jgi:hypothetical protein
MNANYFQQAIDDAKAYRDRVVAPQPHNPYVQVTTMAIGPDNVTLVPCGDATFPRCDAEETSAGALIISSMDDGYVMREYRAGEWAEAVGYDAFGQIAYFRQGAR